MATTQAELDALIAARNTGALTVRHSDGRMVTYRSLEEMDRTIARMQEEIAGTTAGSRSTVAWFSKD
jgi:roadblock/LC7 domain-containing protein